MDWLIRTPISYGLFTQGFWEHFLGFLKKKISLEPGIGKRIASRHLFEKLHKYWLKQKGNREILLRVLALLPSEIYAPNSKNFAMLKNRSSSSQNIRSFDEFCLYWFGALLFDERLADNFNN